MTARSNRALIATLACGLWLGACSNENAAAAPAAATAVSGPTNDPCALTSDAEVRKLFAGAKAGKPDHSVDKYGILTCTWDTPTNMLVAQIFKAEGSAAQEVRSRADGVIDPVKSGAGSKFRYEAVAGVGDDASVLAEAGDPPNGIFNDIAVFGVRKGDRMAVLFAHSLIDGNRETTIKALTNLGKQAAARL